MTVLLSECTRYESLSPGEVQRIYFIRLFLHRPIIAVLDEGTSALPLSMEEMVYQECIRLGITRVSVGHRESLKRFHDVVLTLDLMGGWKLEKIQHPNPSPDNDTNDNGNKSPNKSTS